LIISPTDNLQDWVVPVLNSGKLAHAGVNGVGFGDVEHREVELGLTVTSSAERKSELLKSIPQRPATAVDSGGVLLAVLWPGLGIFELTRSLFFKNSVRS
jgi:hypothetical protein